MKLNSHITTLNLSEPSVDLSTGEEDTADILLGADTTARNQHIETRCLGVICHPKIVVTMSSISIPRTTARSGPF